MMNVLLFQSNQLASVESILSIIFQLPSIFPDNSIAGTYPKSCGAKITLPSLRWFSRLQDSLPDTGNMSAVKDLHLNPNESNGKQRRRKDVSPPAGSKTNSSTKSHLQRGT